MYFLTFVIVIKIIQDCECGGTIQRDIHRTFPAHDFFKEAGGVGQDNLFHLTKAYAVYDTEVGYCQGLTFLAATLLLHVSNFRGLLLFICNQSCLLI